MIQTFQQLWQNPYIRGVIYLLLIALACLFFYETRVIWVSFLISYTLAYLAHPIVTQLERRGLPRWAGVTLSMLVLLAFAGLLLFLASRVVTEVAAFASDIDSFITLLQTLPERLGRLLPPQLRELFIANIGALQGVLEDVGQGALGWLETHRGDLLRGVTGLVGGLFQLVIIFILTAYLLFMFTGFSESALEVVPERHQPLVRELFRKLDSVVGSYLRAQVVIAISVGFAVWLGLMLLDIPLAASLGALAGIANVIPLLGPIIAGVPAILLALTKGWLFVLGVVVLLVVINQIDGNLVSPIVFARTTKIQPITVIIAIAVGLSLFGLWGALLAVPFSAFVKLLYYDYYQQSRWYKSRSET